MVALGGGVRPAPSRRGEEEDPQARQSRRLLYCKSRTCSNVSGACELMGVGSRYCIGVYSSRFVASCDGFQSVQRRFDGFGIQYVVQSRGVLVLESERGGIRTDYGVSRCPTVTTGRWSIARVRDTLVPFVWFIASWVESLCGS